MSVQHLHDYLSRHRVDLQQKPFNEQVGGQQKQNILSLHRSLNALSGGDISGILETYFKSRNGKACYTNLCASPLFSSFSTTLKGIGRQLRNSKKRERIRWISLVSEVDKKVLSQNDIKLTRKQIETGENGWKQKGLVTSGQPFNNVSKKENWMNLNRVELMIF